MGTATSCSSRASVASVSTAGVSGLRDVDEHESRPIHTEPFFADPG